MSRLQPRLSLFSRPHKPRLQPRLFLSLASRGIYMPRLAATGSTCLLRLAGSTCIDWQPRDLHVSCGSRDLHASTGSHGIYMSLAARGIYMHRLAATGSTCLLRLAGSTAATGSICLLRLAGSTCLDCNRASHVSHVSRLSRLSLTLWQYWTINRRTAVHQTGRSQHSRRGCGSPRTRCFGCRPRSTSGRCRACRGPSGGRASASSRGH